MPASAAPTHKSVSSALVRGIQHQLLRAGLDRREFCTRTGVHEDELDSDTARIGALRYARVQQLLRLCLHGGHRLERPPMSALLEDRPRLAALWCNSPTLAAALQHYAEFRALLGDTDTLSLQVQGDVLEVHYRPETHLADRAIGLDSALGNFMLMTSIVDHYRHDGHADLPLQTRVMLCGAPRSALLQFEHTLGTACQVDDGEPAHRLVLKGAGLWNPAAAFHPLLYAHSRRTLEHELRALQRLPPLATRVCAALEALWAQAAEPHAPTEPAGLLARVAERLHLSRWTLRRHLEQEGQTFQALLDDLRAGHARALLADPALSMFDISQRLGFDSQSSFSRFVRHRFGVSPGRVRAGLPATPGPPRPTLSA